MYVLSWKWPYTKGSVEEKTVRKNYHWGQSFAKDPDQFCSGDLCFSLFFLKVSSISSTSIGQPMKKVVTKF